MNRDDRFSRQSFLGAGAQRAIERRTVAVVGLCGGGSHIVQQLAHVGFKKFVLYDPDRVDKSNLNRLVGATYRDAVRGILKVKLGKRVILAVRPSDAVEAYGCRWQDNPPPLRKADIIVSCVDSFAQRRDLEACARRYIIPYVDVGIDVYTRPGEAPQLGGQVILSLPGCPCLTCLGFLTEERLAAEASRYGDAGQRPQVVWANGIVASTAVGVVIGLLTNWTVQPKRLIYLSYYGNTGNVQPHARLSFIDVDRPCPHYKSENVGDPVFARLCAA